MKRARIWHTMPAMLDPTLARQRQNRLLAATQAAGVDALTISDPRHVHYLTAYLPAGSHRAALVLRAGGRSTLIAPGKPRTDVAADEVVQYPPMLRLDQPAHVAKLAAAPLIGACRIGFDSSDVAAHLLCHTKDAVNIDATLHQMRRVKDADELAVMQRAIDATQAMYARARQIIEPGIPEIEVYNQLHGVAVQTFGEPMTALLGNDFACGTGGGMPRDKRTAQAGELYILDLGPAYRGYFADNCRAIAVDRKPTDAQMKAWQSIVNVFPIVESLAKPGARTLDLYNAVDEHFRARFNRLQHHHLGHGVGLVPHELPFLKPEHDYTLAEGEIFTAEPGIYAPELRGGLRLENQYLVTKTGVRNLTPFPLELT
jgi:Xaa-Pro dipeptidase